MTMPTDAIQRLINRTISVSWTPYGEIVEASEQLQAIVAEVENQQTVALEPVERVALDVAFAQVQRGERPMSNVATVCVLALARITGKEAAGEILDDNLFYRVERKGQ